MSRYMVSGKVAKSGGANSAITPRSPIERAAERPVAKPSAPLMRGQITRRKKVNPVMPSDAPRRP